jgi:hypothetical protein
LFGGVWREEKAGYTAKLTIAGSILIEVPGKVGSKLND